MRAPTSTAAASHISSQTALNQTGGRRSIDIDDEPQKVPIDLDDDVPEVASFAPGTIIRLANLGKCAQLNGKVCTVLKYDPQRQRYQVRLRHAVAGDSHKAVQASNMLSLPLVEEIGFLRDDLLHLNTSPSVVKSVLIRLAALPISKGLLGDTKVPKAVKEIEKRFSHTSHTDIINKSRELIKRWRNVWRGDEGDAAESGQQAPSTPADKASLSSQAAAEQLVDVMRKAPIHQMRIAALAALDGTDVDSLSAFVDVGGLAVIESWVKTRRELRSSCIKVYHGILSAISRMDERSKALIFCSVANVATSDPDADVQRQARSIIDRWFPNTCVPTNGNGTGEAADSRTRPLASSSSSDGPEQKRQRLAERIGQSRGNPTSYASMASKQETQGMASSEAKRAAELASAFSSAFASSSSAGTSAQAPARKRVQFVEPRSEGPSLSDSTSSQFLRGKQQVTSGSSAASVEVTRSQPAGDVTRSQPVARLDKAEAAASNGGEGKFHSAASAAREQGAYKVRSQDDYIANAKKERTVATASQSPSPAAGTASPPASSTAPSAAAGTPDPRAAFVAKPMQAANGHAFEAKPMQTAVGQSASQSRPAPTKSASAASTVSMPSAAYKAHAAAVGKDQAVGLAPTSLPLDTRSQTAHAQVTAAASAESLPPPVPASLPPGLGKVDPRVVHKLQTNPKIMEFLNRHPNVWKNFNNENVAFLVRRLEKSRATNEESGEHVIDADTSDEDHRSIVFSRLHQKLEATDIEDMLVDASCVPRRVSIPRESRRKRSCGLAYAVLESREEAERAVEALHEKVVMGQPISVTHLVKGKPADALAPSGEHRRKIRWKEEEALWDVAVYDPNVRIAEMGRNLHKPDPNSEAVVFGSAGNNDRSGFKAAARADMEAEAMMVRKALNHEDM